jgi:hypothetical protein
MTEKIQSQQGGILIESINPQPEVRNNAAMLFKDRFLDPVLLTDRGCLSDPVISFNNLRNQNTLASYTLARNPQGLLYHSDEFRTLHRFGSGLLI